MRNTPDTILPLFIIGGPSLSNPRCQPSIATVDDARFRRS